MSAKVTKKYVQLYFLKKISRFNYIIVILILI